MGCRSCSRRSNKKRSQPVTPPDITYDFTIIGPTQTKIRSGNGQQYSIMAPLVKMRPPTGWSIWTSIKGHKHFIDGKSAVEIVEEVIARYAANDIELDPKVAWFNANRIWVTKMNPRHSYATTADLRAISEPLVKPLIWNSTEWENFGDLVWTDPYDPDATKTELFRLFEVAQNKITGCEVCYDELTQTPYQIEDQIFMQEWFEQRFANIVTANA